MSTKARLLTILIILLLVSSACTEEEPEPTPTPVPTPTPEQYLENAAQAMTAFSSVQFSQTRDGSPLVLDSNPAFMI